LAGESEFEYTRACLAAKLFPNNAPPNPPQDLNWEELYAFLSAQRLGAYVYSFRETFQNIWPSSFLENLRYDHYAFLLYGSQCNTQIEILLTALNERKIPVIVLKGWALIQTLYHGDFSQRFCQDIDLLVHPRNIDCTENVLHVQGYQGSEEVWPGFSRRYNNDRDYSSPTPQGPLCSNLAVGLHWGLFHTPSYNPKLVNIADLFQHAQKITVAGQRVLELSLEDQVVYMSAHLGLHHRHEETIAQYYEIAGIIRRAGRDLDWHKIASQAYRWKCAMQVKNVLNKIEGLWLGVVDPAGLAELDLVKITWSQRCFEGWIEKTSGHGVFAALLEWLTLPGWKRRFSMFFEQAFPCPHYMRERYASSKRTWLVCLYVYRFFQAFKSLLHMPHLQRATRHNG
jgi:hypothetical protein